MDKPQHLYHASPIKNIKEFEPRNEVPRYDGEANLVFATPKEALAAMFLAPRDFSIEIAMYDSKYVIFIEADEEAYDQKDTGGAIYELPTESFETDAQHGMGAVEWYSKVAVKPLAKTVYESSIEAMDRFGVTRHFVNSDMMNRIRQDPANALNILS
jgi:hypothetical protein